MSTRALLTAQQSEFAAYESEYRRTLANPNAFSRDAFACWLMQQYPEIARRCITRMYTLVRNAL